MLCNDWLCFLNHCVGAQLREWLLYYSLPVLKGVLPGNVLDHFSYLVAGAHIVLSNAICEADLDLAELCFKEFYSRCTSIYGMQLIHGEYDISINTQPYTGSSAATIKVHLLRHIVSCVRDWGPLWAYFCFHFEAQNHLLKKLFHGSRNTSKEVGFYDLLNTIHVHALGQVIRLYS